jgi:hypothetical protein
MTPVGRKPKEERRVGAEIDSYCTKCRLMTNHRIVALDGGKIRKVICLTCDGQHAYRMTLPKPKVAPEDANAEAPAAKPKAPRVTRAPRQPREPKRLLIDEPEPANLKWREMVETYGVARPTPYDIHGSFESGQTLEHSSFGVGFVIRALPPNKIEVLFENEIKILIMAVATPQAEETEETEEAV